jgi:hypothetical protein
MKERILLITPVFYGFEKLISAELEKSGYAVVWLENKELAFDYHRTSAKLRLIRKILFLLFSPQRTYLKKKLHKLDNLKFDILFAVNCFIICPYLFKRLRYFNADLRSMLYLWDSVELYSWKKESKLFDNVYSFDRKDAVNNNWFYLPNFHTGQREGKKNKIIYDIYFAGKFTPVRFRILERILDLLKYSDLNCKIVLVPTFKNVLHNRILYRLLKLSGIKTHWIKDFLLTYEVNEGLIFRDFIYREQDDFSEIRNEMNSSNVILDINNPGQSGYSHRLVEALCSGKKVITDNLDIKRENGFNPERIKVIDNINPALDADWIKERAEFNAESTFEFLELSEWIREIFHE